MIAVCPNCKSIFEDRGIVIRGASHVRLSNNTTRCPRCGSWAKYLDGTFNFDANGVITVLSAPQFTIDILKRIKSLVEDVQNKKITPEEFHEEVDSLPPVIRNAMGLVIPRDPSGFWAMIGVLLLVLNQLTGVKTDTKHEQAPTSPKPKIELIDKNPIDSILPKKDTITPSDDDTFFNEK